MIPVVNHGRRTGNPEPGLLRHVRSIISGNYNPISPVLGYLLYACCNYDYTTTYICIVYYLYYHNNYILNSLRSSQSVIRKWMPFKVYLD